MSVVTQSRYLSRKVHQDHATATIIARQFRMSPYVAIRHLDCEVEDGVAVIFGKVPTYYTKQVAITLAKSTEGVDAIEDHIGVTSRPNLVGVYASQRDGQDV